MLKSHGHLRKLYRNYNTRFFDGALPEDTAVCWSGDIPNSLAGQTRRWVNGETGQSQFEIRLNPAIRDWSAYYKHVLLHEMAHVKLAPDTRHGKRFNQEMLRLACMGAFHHLW